MFARIVFLPVMLAFLLVMLPHSQAESPTITSRYPEGSIQSEEVADRALKEIKLEQQNIDAHFSSSERACYEEFFATNCVQRAKSARRDALARLRMIEIEANTFKRRARADANKRKAAER